MKKQIEEKASYKKPDVKKLGALKTETLGVNSVNTDNATNATASQNPAK